jgi:hypothetical protein
MVVPKVASTTAVTGSGKPVEKFSFQARCLSIPF